MSELMISVSGIRGIIGESLTPKVLINYTSAYSKLVGKGTIVIARDSRTSGEMVESFVTGVLLSAGCRVVSLGIVPTPTAEIMTGQMETRGGIIITASHNPAEWNALKFLNSDGMFLNYNEIEQLRMLAKNKWDDHCVTWSGIHTIEKDTSALSIHREKLLSLPYIDVPGLKERKFRVVLDSNHGAGGILGRQLLEALGCEVISISEEPNGRFQHPCEPIPENLQIICHKVQETAADIGFALDPDSDRLAIISEKGIAIGEEYTMAIATKCMLEKVKGPVTINLSTSRMAEEIAETYGVPCYRTPVGEINVSTAMKKNGSIIGGEGNGGAIIPDVLYGRDAFSGMVLTLQHLLDTKKTVSEAISLLPFYVMKKEKVPRNNLDPDRILQHLEVMLSSSSSICNKEDGLRISWPDSWVHIRKSNTEPILRIITETRTRKQTDALSEKIRDSITHLS